ncbi:MAG: hypothetical protein COU85_01770 [Candidatus Portnoybacteria bacterium CG10_big_fil_rev_8_21_14_0_10_44_7]|uniref:Magnesium transport protein CorA n=1 Tax=Candidatus Portnoybacteria bacterium CG10_big_fil_rev_8_21_14_0_10_44_7 TaxID=1974816 RepID=A0A2M8KIQ5_9BACT|nr:MAG: hypothetical protein COU85_01770 [Candidatus Portnoybacteria bacterium CG10_big_fil_rev_8_21_14_0_10_44_7]
MKKIIHNNLIWTDYFKIDQQQASELKEQFGLPQAVFDELVPRQTRAKIEEYNNFLYMVMHFPVHNEQKRETRPLELDFIITRDEIVTIHGGTIPALKEFFEGCADHDDLKNQYFKNAGYLLLSMLDKLIDSSLPMLDHIQEKIEQIEERRFRGEERELLMEIAVVKHDIIDFRRSIKPQRSVLNILAKKAPRFLGAESDYLVQEVIGSNLRVWNVLENMKETIESLEETNNSLLSYKISDIMKILTIVSFITFPLSVIAGLFGMNVYDAVGFTKNPNTWWIILTIMGSATVLMVVYFKKRKWF